MGRAHFDAHNTSTLHYASIRWPPCGTGAFADADFHFLAQPNFRRRFPRRAPASEALTDICASSDAMRRPTDYNDFFHY